jgi:hypothetical protein
MGRIYDGHMGRGRWRVDGCYTSRGISATRRAGSETSRQAVQSHISQTLRQRNDGHQRGNRVQYYGRCTTEAGEQPTNADFCRWVIDYHRGRRDMSLIAKDAVTTRLGVWKQVMPTGGWTVPCRRGRHAIIGIRTCAVVGSGGG